MLVFLNPDTVVKGNALQDLAATLGRLPEVGVVGPLMRYGDNSLQLSFGYKSGFMNFVEIVLWHLIPSRLAERIILALPRPGKADKPYLEVGWVSGACLAVRRDLFNQVNGFDENLFLSAQDALDLCKRIRRIGPSVAYDPPQR